MRISNLAALIVSLASLSAYADLKPIADGTPAMDHAINANGIFSVKSVRSGDLTYKLVTLDTPLNGSVNNTSILLTGGEVGGEAGFEAAFLISPQMENDKATVATADDIKLSPSGVELYTFDIEGNRTKRTIKFDPKSKVLKEGTKSDAPDCDAMTSSNDVYQCIMAESEKADKTLNSTYAKTMKNIGDETAQAKLKASERAWLSYRTAQCKISSDVMRGGSGERNMNAGCQLRMTKKRIVELLEMNN